MSDTVLCMSDMYLPIVYRYRYMSDKILKWVTYTWNEWHLPEISDIY